MPPSTRTTTVTALLGGVLVAALAPRGRYGAEVYAIDTASGKQPARIPVGSGPHGPAGHRSTADYSQPGRHSLGHTGVFR